MAAMKTHKEKLGEMLLRLQLIRPEDLAAALEEQQKSRRLLGAVLVEKGLVSSARIAELLKLQRSSEAVTLSLLDPAPATVKLIPERLAKRFLALAFDKGDGNELKVAMAEPSDIIAVDTIRSITGFEIHPVRARAEEILTAIQKYYYGFSSGTEASVEVPEVEFAGGHEEEAETSEIKFQANDPPVIKYVNMLFVQVIENRASDIHLEPMEKSISCRFRIDGVLRPGTPPATGMYPGVVSRIKIISKLDIAERRKPQDGRCEIKVGEKLLDLRISIFPTVFGEKVVIRVLDRSSLILNLEELGMEGSQMDAFKNALKKPHGIILITGPTGAGKTTTLYAGLAYTNNPDKNIITLEDPVEYRLEGINQTQVRPEIGLTFATYLRHVLRQDPDVIMVGEIRDLETAEIAIRAALTGHLVLSTVHTNDSVSTITRLMDMGIQPYLLPPSLNLVIAQRLVRRLCPECKQPGPPSSLLGPGVQCYQARGCPFCNQTGYWGRIGIYEVLEITPEIRELIIKGGNPDLLKSLARKQGMKGLLPGGLGKVSQGITSLEEVLGMMED